MGPAQLAGVRSERELATRLGVSRATLSQALVALDKLDKVGRDGVKAFKDAIKKAKIVHEEYLPQNTTDFTAGARTHAGVGAELRVLPFIPLRAGFSLYDEGFALAAGTGIELGPVNLTISAQDRHSRHGRAPGFAAGVSMGDIRR